MAVLAGLAVAVAVILVAFLPSFYYLVRTRESERYGREPYRRLLFVFAFGAIGAVIVSIILELLILGNLNRFDRLYYLGDESFLGPVVVAPFVEEFAKAIAIVLVASHFTRQEDGIVYGVAAGLGFAATENLLYEMAALAVGLVPFIVTAIVRSISSTLLHATATGVTGLGIGQAQMKRLRLISVTPYYLVAVLMHAVFNLVAGLSITHPGLFGDHTHFVSLLFCVGFAIVAFAIVRQRISGK